MKKKGHRRSRVIGTAVAAVTALALGGGGILLVTSNASAGNGTAAPAPSENGQRTATIDCPDVAEQLSQVSQRARSEVDAQLAQLDTQVADAYKRWAASWEKAGPSRVDTSILRPLTEERRETIGRIATAIGNGAGQPGDLKSMAPCTLKRDTAAPVPAGSAPAQPQDAQAQGQGGGQQQPSGPVRADFVDITKIRPNVAKPRPREDASVGTFTSRCGRNGNKHFNPDNVIVAPGVSNGAHHMHDYVGNLDTSAFSTDDSLAAAGTTCTNGDRSTHYWPVLRLRNGQREADANAPGGGQDGNVGRILQPASVSLTFKGSPAAKVTAMPRFLRIITGDAKAFTNGLTNANASWSCTGFENRQLKDKFPICPQGSKVVRTFNFQSCWDGSNTDSANHRTHVAFARSDGSCASGFKAVPKLVQRITYNVPRGSVFAVDSFPEQLHKPVTDHSDFINVMSRSLMRKAVSCINSGRTCG
ncbi:DUF1996 domain-containing protein [Streptomyces sp. NPDC004647]|uniref:DUF1996 domain-containing protein n=1 Tax=Streptomyces sp. NPDC004647 TaxID=3154671 RepID=UPI0033A7A540